MRFFFGALSIMLLAVLPGCSTSSKMVAAASIQRSKCVSDLEQLGRAHRDDLATCAAYSRLAYTQIAISGVFYVLVPGPLHDAATQRSPCVDDLTRLDQSDLSICSQLAELALRNATIDS